MSPLIILGLMTAGLFAIALNQIDYTTNEDYGDGSGGDSSDPTDVGSVDESLTGGVTDSGNTDNDILTIAAGGTLTGTEGNDTIEMDGPAGDPISVDALEGNDRIDLYDEDAVASDADFLNQQLVGSTIDGGFGNDRIDAATFNSTVSGNYGNDTITGTHDNSLIDAGVGNDRVEIDSFGESATTVLGGDGADIIDAHINGGTVDGGAGNDVLHAYSGGTAVTSVSGGAGIDFFDIDATDLPIAAGEVGFSVTGGAGVDVFQVAVNEGVQDTSFWLGENVSVTPEGALRVDTGEITDFTPGEDLLVIDGAPAAGGVALSSIDLEEVAQADAISTQVTLTYSSTTPGVLTREVVFTLNGASGLSATDIQLIGTDPGVLEFVPLPEAAA